MLTKEIKQDNEPNKGELLQQKPTSPEIEAVWKDIREILESKDRFLENPPRQPKKEIADMVESHGVLVPRRFGNLTDALGAIRQGKTSS